MRCLKCLKPIKRIKYVEVNKHLAHINNWGVCFICREIEDETKKLIQSDYYHKNKDKYRELHKKYKKTLVNSYVANALVDRTNLKAKDIPQEMIEGKRQYMKINRIISDKKNI